MRFDKFYSAALLFVDEVDFDLSFEVAQSLGQDFVSVSVTVGIPGIGCDLMHCYHFDTYQQFKQWHKEPLSLVQFVKILSEYIDEKLEDFESEEERVNREYEEAKAKAEAM